MTKITLAQRFGRASAIGAAGLIVALMIVYFDRHFRADWGFMRCATAGAFLAGLIVARGFGRQGPWGWFWAGLSFGGATIMGAIFAVLMLPLDAALMKSGLVTGFGNWSGSSIMGPIFVVSMLLENFWVAAAWFAALAGIHTLSSPGKSTVRVLNP